MKHLLHSIPNAFMAHTFCILNFRPEMHSIREYHKLHNLVFPFWKLSRTCQISQVLKILVLSKEATCTLTPLLTVAYYYW